ncbi:uncharacterized protein LOC127170097 [Labeo rohita]|uniref:uncharacterized protein LOC127170097 n=1 Tax=Labeo rohita TaxID=84645 RepID=UPI0021E337A8|nr:uncharacterized protein LOC127170097 [Labeo rohita]XP_050973831.1 uncharacterized protein LOC127170097 [Labeo rohita]
MKLISHVLSLVVMLASQKCQELEWIVEPTPDVAYDEYIYSDFGFNFFDFFIESFDVPEPNITVYRQTEDRENVIVTCQFGKTHRSHSYSLSVESELNYTTELLKCSSSDSSEICVYMVTVSPPASFTCEHDCLFADLRSQTYNYSVSVLDHHEEGVSLFYICFSSSIVVGLFIMTAAVIVTNIRSKTKDASDARNPDYNTTTDSPDVWNTATSTSAADPDIRSFLIYNEDHNKCLKVMSATVIQTVLCDVSSEAQHFRWISSSQIMSLSLGLCLGSENISDWVKVILLPCNDLSPVQTWECKDESLFGLKGRSLHLNYGNHDEPNVMLSSGTGVWSRWLIYGTNENLCSRGYHDTYTIGGNSFGKPCHFPFKFGGKWYADCTVDGRADDHLWCSTEEDFDTKEMWGFCPPKNVPVPNITVFKQMEDSEHVVVMCSFGRWLIESSFHLFLKGKQDYILNNALCYSNGKCVFYVKVSSPVFLHL